MPAGYSSHHFNMQNANMKPNYFHSGRGKLQSVAVDGQANIPWDVQHPASPHSCLLRVQPQVRAIPLGPPIYEIRIWVLFLFIWFLRYSTGRGRPQMAHTWLRELCRQVEAEVVSNSRNTGTKFTKPCASHLRAPVTFTYLGSGKLT